MDQTRVVIITGAAGNLGWACAQVFAQHGWHGALLDRTADRLAPRLTELPGGDAHQIVGGVDLLDPGSARDAAAKVLERYGRIDALVHTVGAYRAGPLLETAAADVHAMIDANITTTLHAVQGVLPAMLARGSGRLVAVASMHALRAPAQHAAYAIAKSGVVRLCESLDAEFSPRGVRCSAVLPGTLDTPANRAADPGADHASWISPHAVAQAIAQLCELEAGALGGQGLVVG